MGLPVSWGNSCESWMHFAKWNILRGQAGKVSGWRGLDGTVWTGRDIPATGKTWLTMGSRYCWAPEGCKCWKMRPLLPDLSIFKKKLGNLYSYVKSLDFSKLASTVRVFKKKHSVGQKCPAQTKHICGLGLYQELQVYDFWPRNSIRKQYLYF